MAAKRRNVRAHRETVRAARLPDTALTQPVDEDLFMYCTGVFSDAANVPRPTDARSARLLNFDGAGMVSFNDIPINRGLLAVSKNLQERRVDAATRRAVWWRLLHIEEVFEAGQRFDKWLSGGSTCDKVGVADSLIRACARARIDSEPNGAAFDLDDVARCATAIDARDAVLAVA